MAVRPLRAASGLRFMPTPSDRMDRDESPAGDEPSRRVAEEGWLLQLAARGAGAQQAMRRLFDVYDRRILRFVMRRGLALQEAEDLVQDVFAAVCAKASQFQPGTTPSAWIWSIARHRWVDVMRQRERTRRIFSEADEATVDVVEQIAAEPAAVPDGAADECVRGALRAFEKLWPEAATTLRLRLIEGWSIEQMAEYLGRTPGATRQYISELRKKVKPFFEACLELLST